eukprot:7672186-Alexandrium_andersonii.AAC.1
MPHSPVIPFVMHGTEGPIVPPSYSFAAVPVDAVSALPFETSGSFGRCVQVRPLEFQCRFTAPRHGAAMNEVTLARFPKGSRLRQQCIS